MSNWLKQSTAVTVKLGPALDSADGNTEETGLTIAQADIRLTKNGGAYAQTNNAAGATHDEKGNYGVPLNSTDTNTPGTLRVYIHVAGALPFWQDFMVVPSNAWDSMFGSDKLQVDIREISGDSAAADNLPADLDAEIALIKGALGFNCVLDNFSYDVNGKATAGTLYIYDSAANAATHNPPTGLLMKINGVAVITGGNTTKLTRTEV